MYANRGNQPNLDAAKPSANVDGARIAKDLKETLAEIGLNPEVTYHDGRAVITVKSEEERFKVALALEASGGFTRSQDGLGNKIYSYNDKTGSGYPDFEAVIAIAPKYKKN